ncbi:MAG: hypothetical protein BroJett026_08510 [Betaproteobacteria bacterium]|nr:MAG: hypothetical protein BroJett026_08510 [Betaproteobacteria bacterium]
MATTPDDVRRALEAAPERRIDRTHAHEAARYLSRSLALFAGYLLLDGASFLFWVDPVPVKPWNPQVGLAVALLCAAGLRFAPAVFAGALASEILLRSPGHPAAVQVVCALALTIAMIAIAFALRRRGFPRVLGTVRSTRDFFAIAAAGALLSSFAYVSTSLAVTGAPFDALWSSVLHKWLGDALGMVGATPLTLLAVSPRGFRAPEMPRSTLAFDLAVFAVSLLIVLAVVFGSGPIRGERLFYLLFLPLIVIAVRRGLAGAAVGIAATQVAIIVALRIDQRTIEDATGYQIMMLALGATTLLLGAVAGERRRTQLELERRSAELRAQQQALADAMRVAAASETASTLAHEMSQPLSAIGTYARAGVEMLRRGTASPDELNNVLQRIVAESARTRETVQRIRDFFRTGVIHREPVEVRRLASDVEGAMRDRLRAEGIAFGVDVPERIAQVDVDRVQVGTVLHNLVGNAADAVAGAPAPRWIRIAARERGPHVEIDVIDSGPGIEPGMREALFEPLATTKPTGMGLGLAIARTLVTAHGGRLELAHLHPTTFRFTLPIHGSDEP